MLPGVMFLSSQQQPVRKINISLDDVLDADRMCNENTTIYKTFHRIGASILPIIE